MARDFNLSNDFLYCLTKHPKSGHYILETYCLFIGEGIVSGELPRKYLKYFNKNISG